MRQNFSKRLPAAMLGLLAIASCAPADLLNATISRDGLLITHDVAYGPDPREKLDIYQPTSVSVAPVLVFFYGGAWNSGSKRLYPFVAATLARRGNIVVVPDYRLYPQVRFPAFLEDNAKAVAWAEAHLRELGGDPQRLFLMGHSAGAYNAAMLATNPAYLAHAGSSRGHIAGFIGLAGPYDFLPMTDPDAKAVFATVGDDPQTQPVTFADSHAPPMLLLAGGDDETVRPRNSQSLAEKVEKSGGQAQVKIYPGVGHIGLVIAIAPLFQKRAPVLADTETFIQTHRLHP